MAKGKYERWITKEGLALIEGWAREGLTDEQIAHNMGIAVKTLYNWKNAHIPILQALKKGKEVSDYEVESSLFKRANGYRYDEITYVEVEMSQEERDELIDATMEKWDEEHPDAPANLRAAIIAKVPRTKQAIAKRVTKEVAPDTTAQIFWLKNRKPSKWRDKQEIEHSGTMHNQVDLSGLSLEELRRLANEDK